MRRRVRWVWVVGVVALMGLAVGCVRLPGGSTPAEPAAGEGHPAYETGASGTGVEDDKPRAASNGGPGTTGSPGADDDERATAEAGDPGAGASGEPGSAASAGSAGSPEEPGAPDGRPGAHGHSAASDAASSPTGEEGGPGSPPHAGSLPPTTTPERPSEYLSWPGFDLATASDADGPPAWFLDLAAMDCGNIRGDGLSGADLALVEGARAVCPTVQAGGETDWELAERSYAELSATGGVPEADRWECEAYILLETIVTAHQAEPDTVFHVDDDAARAEAVYAPCS
ncbi:hypothetical protein ACTWP5_04310 [Streptomyces sp. 4N509B]|uniref:hypothetical protein n=1 Tax=Streptomyces sp. 4N509B TaxID=3457413 RepID=UPI003FCF9471